MLLGNPAEFVNGRRSRARRQTAAAAAVTLATWSSLSAALIPFAGAAFGHENTTDAVLAAGRPASAPHPGGRPAAAPHQAG